MPFTPQLLFRKCLAGLYLPGHCFIDEHCEHLQGQLLPVLSLITVLASARPWGKHAYAPWRTQITWGLHRTDRLAC